jgi:hypothetical protein
MSTSDDNKWAWLDRGLCRTNPVYVAEQYLAHLEPLYAEDLFRGTQAAQDRMAGRLRALAAEGGRVPGHALARLIEERALPADFSLGGDERRPGVLGLVVELNSPLKLVLPLELTRGAWRVEPSLPFTAEDIQDGLVRLMHAAEMPTAGVIPERLGYAFGNPLGHRVEGNSMTVAALLAVLDELGGWAADLFRAACALVEVLPDGRLAPVGRVADKLEAALRECGRLSLVICHPDSPKLACFAPEELGEVWAVDSLAALAGRLQKAGLLGPLLRQTPLNRAEAARVRDRLRWLVRQEYREAADLGDRLRACTRADPAEPAVWAEMTRLYAAACRHQGRYTDATGLGRQILDEVAGLGPLSSDDEEAAAAAEYAAALFDNHQFADVPPVLERWAEAAALTPRCFRPLTRVMVWNTLARARVILGRGGWEELFRQSLDLNRRLGDVDNVGRTASYLVHGLLRVGRTDDASAELERVGLRRDPLPPADPWRGFDLANAARYAGDRWEHPELDRACPVTSGPKHAFGLYLQATARQRGRDPADAVERFGRAAAFLRAEAGDADDNICVLFALLLELAAAAELGHAEGWETSAASVRSFLGHPPAAPLRDHYLPALARLPGAPDRAAAENLLRLVPYF